MLDAATEAVLRRQELTASPAELNALPERAARASAKLLDVPLIDGRTLDRDELATVPPAASKAVTSTASAPSIGDSSSALSVVGKTMGRPPPGL